MGELMNFKDIEVEVFELDGKVLFNPKHCGRCLDLTDSAVRNHMSKMSDKQAILVKNSTVRDKDFRKIHNTGEKFLTEAGVYKLIFKSNKKEAEEFQDWVTDEVLPQIKNTGGYIPVTQEDDDLTIMAKAMQIMNTTLEKKDDIIKNLQQKITEDEPKVLFANQLAKTKELVPIGNYAKTLCHGGFEIGQNRLFQWLRDNNILTKDNLPYQQYIVNGAFEVNRYVQFKDGEYKQRSRTLITPKGQLYLFKKMLKDPDLGLAA